MRHKPHIKKFKGYYRVFWKDTVTGVVLWPGYVSRGERRSQAAIKAHAHCDKLNSQR